MRGPRTLGPRGASGRAAAALAAALLLIFAAPAHAQEAANLGKLSGTLRIKMAAAKIVPGQAQLARMTRLRPAWA